MSIPEAKEGDSIVLDMSPDQVRRYLECKLIVSTTNEQIQNDTEVELIDQSKIIVLETIEPREELTPTILAKKKVFRYMFRTSGVFLV